MTKALAEKKKVQISNQSGSKIEDNTSLITSENNEIVSDRSKFKQPS